MTNEPTDSGKNELSKNESTQNGASNKSAQGDTINFGKSEDFRRRVLDVNSILSAMKRQQTVSPSQDETAAIGSAPGAQGTPQAGPELRAKKKFQEETCMIVVPQAPLPIEIRPGKGNAAEVTPLIDEDSKTAAAGASDQKTARSEHKTLTGGLASSERARLFASNQNAASYRVNTGCFDLKSLQQGVELTAQTVQPGASTPDTAPSVDVAAARASAPPSAKPAQPQVQGQAGSPQPNAASGPTPRTAAAQAPGQAKPAAAPAAATPTPKAPISATPNKAAGASGQPLDMSSFSLEEALALAPVEDVQVKTGVFNLNEVDGGAKLLAQKKAAAANAAPGAVKPASASGVPVAKTGAGPGTTPGAKPNPATGVMPGAATSGNAGAVKPAQHAPTTKPSQSPGPVAARTAAATPAPIKPVTSGLAQSPKPANPTAPGVSPATAKPASDAKPTPAVASGGATAAAPTPATTAQPAPSTQNSSQLTRIKSTKTGGEFQRPSGNMFAKLMQQTQSQPLPGHLATPQAEPQTKPSALPPAAAQPAAPVKVSVEPAAKPGVVAAQAAPSPAPSAPPSPAEARAASPPASAPAATPVPKSGMEPKSPVAPTATPVEEPESPVASPSAPGLEPHRQLEHEPMPVAEAAAEPQEQPTLARHSQTEAKFEDDTEPAAAREVMIDARPVADLDIHFSVSGSLPDTDRLISMHSIQRLMPKRAAERWSRPEPGQGLAGGLGQNRFGSAATDQTLPPAQNQQLAASELQSRAEGSEDAALAAQQERTLRSAPLPAEQSGSGGKPAVSNRLSRPKSKTWLDRILNR